MGKHDLKFFASLCGGFGILFGLGGHLLKFMSTQDPDLYGNLFGGSSSFDLMVYVGTFLWMVAVGSLAKSRHFSPLWGLTGILMLVPVVGVAPWFFVNSAADPKPDISDALMRIDRDSGMRLAGDVQVRYSSEELDKSRLRPDVVRPTEDPWQNEPDKRAMRIEAPKASPKPKIEVRPMIKADRKYRW